MEANNMKAMREALAGLIDGICFHCDLSEDCKGAPCEKMQKAKAALAAPPRNCDLYDNESCRMAYHLHGDGTMTMQAFADWLFAPATEQEGGAK